MRREDGIVGKLGRSGAEWRLRGGFALGSWDKAEGASSCARRSLHQKLGRAMCRYSARNRAVNNRLCGPEDRWMSEPAAIFSNILEITRCRVHAACVTHRNPMHLVAQPITKLTTSDGKPRRRDQYRRLGIERNTRDEENKRHVSIEQNLWNLNVRSREAILGSRLIKS